MAAEIFISFASKDIKIATTLCGALESRGFSCWISARDIAPGANFQVSIVRALRHARVMLLVFTANSNTSEEMTKELALASQQKLMVIPLRVEDVTPSDAFAYEFATRQWIDAFADWEASLDQLSRRIAYALEEAPAGVNPPLRAEPEPALVPTAAAAPALVETTASPPALAKAAGKIDRPARNAEPAPADKAAADPAPEPEMADAAPSSAGRSRRLAVPVAVAACVAGVALAIAASTLLRSPAGDPNVAATPRLATALVVKPAAPPTDPLVVPEEETPRLVKANRTKAVKADAAGHPDADIPY